MDEKTTFEKLRDLLVEEWGCLPEAVTETASFVEALHFDSLETVELVMDLEEDWEIDIPDEVSANIQTVGEAVKVIDELVAAKKKAE